MKYFKSFNAAVIFLFGILTVLLISCRNEKKITVRNLTVVFYNVENLFDTVDEPGKNDDEFTPEGSKKWTMERYQKKLEDLARVLSSVNKTELPGIIGLVEIENRKVLTGLTGTDYLKPGNYKIIHYESPDIRGIDNALLYRPDRFTVLVSRPFRVTFENDPGYATRDILYVKGKATDGEVFNIFVNHWPSRIRGEEQSELMRVRVAEILRSKIDSLRDADKDPEIVILGDMNDEPSNTSLLNILGAKDPEKEPQAFLQNLMFATDNQGLGSYKFQNEWDMIDNIIVSRNLLDNDGFRCTEKQGHVFHEEWMEFKNRDGNISPNRTYGGNNYYGGISDHYPVYFEMEKAP